jgi:hypothetical protein
MTTKSYSTQGSQLYFPDTSASPVVVDPIAQMTGFTGLGGKKTKIDITNYDSPGYKEYAGGLLDAGELTFDLIWDFTNANHILIQKLAASANATRDFVFGASDGTAPPTFTGTLAAGPIVLVPPVSASPKLYTRSGFLFSGYFSTFTVAAPVDSIIKVSCAVQQTGSILTFVKGVAPPA